MTYIILLFLIYFGFKFNLSTGIIVTAISLGYVVYARIPSVYVMLGNRAYTKDDNEKAVEYYEKAMATGRAKASAGITYVLMLMRMGRLDKALSVTDSIIASRKTKIQEKYILKEYRSLIYFKQGNREEALEDAKEIFENYKNTTIYGLLGYLKLACGEPLEETMEFCLEAYDYNSDDRDIVDNLVLAYYKNGDYEKAEELAKELVEMSPSFVEAYYHSALVAKALGKTEEAKEFLEHIDDCIRTALTTVSEEEIEELRAEL